MSEYIVDFLQPTIPVSQNQLTRQLYAARGQHVVRKWKDEWQTAAFWAWKQQRIRESEPAAVTVHLTFRQQRVRDPHNYVGTVCKWIIDGLVLAGTWPDDNPQYVKLHEPVLRKTTAELPKCYVHLGPMEG